MKKDRIVHGREKHVKKFTRRMEEIGVEVADRPLRENEVEEIKLTKQND